MKINRLNIDAGFFFDRFLSRSQFGVASVTLCGSYLNVVAGVWTWGEQADRRSAFFFSVTDGWLSFTMDCHLLLWLHFSATSLNMRLLRHTHALLQTALTDEHTLIQTDGKRQTLNTTHTHTHTHTAHPSVHFFLPHQQFLPMMHLCFLSLNALQNVWRLENDLLSSSLFFSSLNKKNKQKKTNSNLDSKTWASQADRNKLNINSSST